MDLIDGDVVKRLRVLAAWAHDDGRTLIAAAASDAASEIERLRSRVSKLEARLEIDHVYKLVDGKTQRIEIAPEDRDKQYDGIECRDETIKLLDANIKRLRSALAAEREECAKVADRHHDEERDPYSKASAAHIAAAIRART